MAQDEIGDWVENTVGLPIYKDAFKNFQFGSIDEIKLVPRGLFSTNIIAMMGGDKIAPIAHVAKFMKHYDILSGEMKEELDFVSHDKFMAQLSRLGRLKTRRQIREGFLKHKVDPIDEKALNRDESLKELGRTILKRLTSNTDDRNKHPLSAITGCSGAGKTCLMFLLATYVNSEEFKQDIQNGIYDTDLVSGGVIREAVEDRRALSNAMCLFITYQDSTPYYPEYDGIRLTNGDTDNNLSYNPYLLWRIIYELIDFNDIQSLYEFFEYISTKYANSDRIRPFVVNKIFEKMFKQRTVYIFIDETLKVKYIQDVFHTASALLSGPDSRQFRHVIVSALVGYAYGKYYTASGRPFDFIRCPLLKQQHVVEMFKDHIAKYQTDRSKDEFFSIILNTNGVPKLVSILHEECVKSDSLASILDNYSKKISAYLKAKKFTRKYSLEFIANLLKKRSGSDDGFAIENVLIKTGVYIGEPETRNNARAVPAAMQIDDNNNDEKDIDIDMGGATGVSDSNDEKNGDSNDIENSITFGQFAEEGYIKIEDDGVYIAPEILYRICEEKECTEILDAVKLGVRTNINFVPESVETLLAANEVLLGAIYSPKFTMPYWEFFNLSHDSKLIPPVLRDCKIILSPLTINTESYNYFISTGAAEPKALSDEDWIILDKSNQVILFGNRCHLAIDLMTLHEDDNGSPSEKRTVYQVKVLSKSQSRGDTLDKIIDHFCKTLNNCINLPDGHGDKYKKEYILVVATMTDENLDGETRSAYIQGVQTHVVTLNNQNLVNFLLPIFRFGALDVPNVIARSLHQIAVDDNGNDVV